MKLYFIIMKYGKLLNTLLCVRGSYTLCLEGLDKPHRLDVLYVSSQENAFLKDVMVIGAEARSVSCPLLVHVLLVEMK